MSDNIKITMLGYTGSGKTCFMTGMYAVMQLGIQGFTLSTQDLDEDIDLTDRWEQMLEGGDDRFPTGTTDTYNYAFDFCYGLKPLMGFEWLDYRGGALRGKSSESDVQELRGILSDSSCVFLCISGEYLKDSITTQTDLQKTARGTRATQMNSLLQKLRKRKEGVIPVVIAITKYDLCSHRKKDDIARDIQKLFDGLFTRDSGWLVTICPVSLGKALASDLDGGDIEPINLHIPLIFAIYAKLSEDATQKQNHESALSSQLRALQDKNAVMRWLESDSIDRLNTQINQNQTQMNEIRDNMSLLGNELGKVLVYQNGEEIDINA